MFNAKSSLCFCMIPAVLAIGIAFVPPAVAQDVIYDNGPDGDVGYYQVNFGALVTNSFTLSAPATITSATVTIYAVDDRNTPKQLKWSITTEPFGGVVKAEGYENLVLLEDPYVTKFLFFGWQMSIPFPNITLPAGTYYLQIQDVVTRWETYAFWAQSSGGSSEAYYQSIGPSGAAQVSEVPSESFTIFGQWNSTQPREIRPRK